MDLLHLLLLQVGRQVFETEGALGEPMPTLDLLRNHRVQLLNATPRRLVNLVQLFNRLLYCRLLRELARSRRSGKQKQQFPVALFPCLIRR